MNRARLTAALTARWNAAQLPERLRLCSLPCGVHIFFSVGMSLKSTNAGRGQPSLVQNRQRLLRPLPSFLRIIDSLNLVEQILWEKSLDYGGRSARQADRRGRNALSFA